MSNDEYPRNEEERLEKEMLDGMIRGFCGITNKDAGDGSTSAKLWRVLAMSVRERIDQADIAQAQMVLERMSMLLSMMFGDRAFAILGWDAAAPKIVITALSGEHPRNMVPILQHVIGAAREVPRDYEGGRMIVPYRPESNEEVGKGQGLN